VTWVEGIPIMDIIKKDMSKDYYQLGKKVGMELQKLHSLSPTNLKADWQTYLKMTVADWKNHPSLSDDEWRNIRCPAFFINGEKDIVWRS
jgi:pimeloyl-ACP methyl ester carboxylesterase